MSKELFEIAEKLLETDERIGKFSSRHREYPEQEARKVFEGITRLVEEIPDNIRPASVDELYEGELRRNLSSRALGLEHFLEGKPYTLEDVISLYGIEEGDLIELRPWLVANRQTTIEAIGRLFDNNEVMNYELALSGDIPRIRTQAEGYAGAQIQNYHQKLGNLFDDLTAAGTYLRRITSEPSTTDRSYFNKRTGRLGLSMTAICYEVEDGTIQLRERELLRLFGHEGMGHGLHQVITNTAKLPLFLKNGSNATIATEEAIAQHYEGVIFEDVRNSRQTQRELRIADGFGQIYQEELDARQIQDFNRNLFYYGILVLSDKSLGRIDDPEIVRKKIELISEVALNPSGARDFVERHRYRYDLDGNLHPEVTSELKYASRAVKRAFGIFQDHGFDYNNRDDRSHIDLTFLTGYFTPVGFVHNARLAAQSRT